MICPVGVWTRGISWRRIRHIRMQYRYTGPSRPLVHAVSPPTDGPRLTARNRRSHPFWLATRMWLFADPEEVRRSNMLGSPAEGEEVVCTQREGPWN